MQICFVSPIYHTICCFLLKALWTFNAGKLVHVATGAHLTLDLIAGRQALLRCTRHGITTKQMSCQTWCLTPRGGVVSQADKNVALAYDSGGNLIAWNRKDNVAMGQHHSFIFKVYVDEEDVEGK